MIQTYFKYLQQFAFIPYNLPLIMMQYSLDIFGLLHQIIRAHTLYYDDHGLPVLHPIKTAKKYLARFRYHIAYKS